MSGSAFGSSHTHSAPCLTGVAPHIFGKLIPVEDQAKIDAYTRELTAKLEQVVLAALASRSARPARLGPGVCWFRCQPAKAPRGTSRIIASPGPQRPPPARTAWWRHRGQLRLPLHDHDPSVNMVSGDWAGYAQEAIEADQPGCVAMTLIGCGGDANPANRQIPGMAARHGGAIADEVRRLLRGPWIELRPRPKSLSKRFKLPFDTLPTRTQLEQLVRAGGPPGYNAAVQLAKLDRGDPLPRELPYSVQTWKFGDRLLMVFLPGEVVVDYVLRLKKELDPGRLWVTAYANDVPCYIPSERILREGGYEGGGAMVYYGQPTRLKPGVEPAHHRRVHRCAGTGFR